MRPERKRGRAEHGKLLRTAAALLKVRVERLSVCKNCNRVVVDQKPCCA